MAACSAHRIAVILGFLVIFTIDVVRARNTSQPTDLVCEEHENPFWSDSYKPIPGEHLGEWNYRLLLALQRIPQQYVGCDKNHNDQFLGKFNVDTAFDSLESEEAQFGPPPIGLYIIRETCFFFVRNYIAQIKKVVERNLLTVLRAQVLSFFNTIPNSRLFFPFENRLVTKLSKEELLETSDQIREYFRPGYTLPAGYHPNDNNHFSYETFNRTLNEITQTHDDVTKMGLYLPYRQAIKNTQEIDDYIRFILFDHHFQGEQSDLAKFLRKLEEGIRVVRKYSFDRPEKVELKFPMIPPCFG